ncbi:MAG: 50S ribosomal protein L25, partial [bacterium]
MIERLRLEAKLRDVADRNNAMRREGFVPAVLYGNKEESINLSVKGIDFEKVYAKTGESTLVDLCLEGQEPIKVIIKDAQKDIIKNAFLHIDFYRVNMMEEIEVELVLNFINEAKAVKELGGSLVKNMETIAVKCLPGDLIESVNVDLSKLENFSDKIFVRDINLPETIKLIDNPNDLIVHVLEQAKEEEEKPVEIEEGDKEEDKKEG